MNAFTTLYGRLLRLNPSTPVPLTPPALPFFGDVIAVSVSPLPQPPLQEEPLEEGALLFAATGPNAPGVVTELLIQPLASRNRRTYREKYRHAAFTTFASGTLAVPVTGLGWVACAYRFVNANSGQATDLAEIGVVRVG